jgi:glycosyltransferase involved in cell wall biosynthesis
MKILHISPSLSRSAGGPFFSVRRVAQELIMQDVQVEAAGVADSFLDEDAMLWHPVQLRAVQKRSPQFLKYCSGLPEQIIASHPDIVHTHGLWLYPHLVAYRHCRKAGTPLVVSPRGMLEPWAFNNNRWKKLPVWWSYEKRALLSARVLHATAVQEAEAFRALGLSNPIAIIPNGVDLPENYSHSCLPTGERTALFLSRIHPKKGLVNLIEAWSKVRPTGWRMIIAGPDEVGHEAELRELVRLSGLSDCFDFVGPAFDQKKEKLFRQANLFVLPSFSENFGNAIAEALAYGVPVITTTATPWAELSRHQSGWWVDVGVQPLTGALREATSITDDCRREMGLRGRNLVRSRYSWSQVAAEMKGVYEWILGGGIRPECVRVID